MIFYTSHQPPHAYRSECNYGRPTYLLTISNSLLKFFYWAPKYLKYLMYRTSTPGKKKRWKIPFKEFLPLALRRTIFFVLRIKFFFLFPRRKWSKMFLHRSPHEMYNSTHMFCIAVGLPFCVMQPLEIEQGSNDWYSYVRLHIWTIRLNVSVRDLECYFS